MRFLPATAILLAAISNAASEGETRSDLRKRLQGAKEPRVLFVGNSYSFAVPEALAALAKETGQALVVEQVTKGGWTLKKHADSKETLERIRSGRWDVVVFQEQSQLPSFGRAQREKEMIPHAAALAAEVRKAGGIPVFFETWGRRDGDKQNAKSYPDDTFAKMQARLNTGYAEAARASGNALVVPVGEAWAKEITGGNGARLYRKDGSHPSAEGVQLATGVFYAFFSGSRL